jgi:hypothetical protein
VGSVIASPAAGTPAVRADAERKVTPLRNRDAWRDTALVWLGQHALLLAATYLAGTLLRFPLGSSGPVAWGTLLSGWLGWDGANYAVIAGQGYHSLWMAAFFPALPAVEHMLAPLTGGNPAVAGMLAANTAELGALGLFRVLAERELGRAPARRALLYLALFPTAFFFAAPYTESLFLLLSVGAFLALRRERWLVAGALAALATLTRSPGILLILPLAAQCALALRDAGAWSYERGGGGLRVAWGRLRPREGLVMLAGLLLPCAAFAGYTVYLHNQLGRWDALAYAQAHGGGRELAWPWVGFLRDARALVQLGFDPNRFQAHILLDTAFALAFIALAVATIRRVALPYVLYAWACLLQAICTPAHNWLALSGIMRYMLVAIPIFFVLGRWGERRGVERALLWAMLPLLALFTAVFVLKGWVA